MRSEYLMLKPEDQEIFPWVLGIKKAVKVMYTCFTCSSNKIILSSVNSSMKLISIPKIITSNLPYPDKEDQRKHFCKCYFYMVKIRVINYIPGQFLLKDCL